MDNILQFSDEWFRLGLITPARLNELEQEYRNGDDKDTEHYRWRIFNKFLEENESISDEMMRALYELGSNDPDPPMGGSIMADVLRLEDCPRDIIDLALRSERSHLVKIAKQKEGKK
jgi:hypothetical protein